jgi:apolipoprotein N-acyltransferase
VASQLRFGIGILAWLAPVPFLRYLRITERWPSRLAFLGASLVAYTLAVAKIITVPLPIAFAPLFGVPLGLALSLPFLAAGPLRRRLGEAPAVVGFSALMVSAEWILHALLPLGTWCSAANTQLDHLALMQLASVTGLHGVSFLVYLVAATLESVIAAPTPRGRRALVGVVAVVLVSSALGQMRLAASTASGMQETEVAAVGTDSTIGAGPLPTDDELRAVNEGLFRRTRAAADAGAAIVVWTEAATLVMPEDETGFLEDVSALARGEDVTLVAAYVVLLSAEPLRYRNRYAFVTPVGVDHIYDKHHPVPGEPAVASDAPMPLYESDELGRVSGAICYDYDFPRLGLAHAALDVDLVVLPSSDWRGIDPIHSEMAAARAIEGGHSLVRSTRFGLSAGYDPWGRARGRLSHFDSGERVLVVSLPRHGVTTIYGVLGDWFPLLCGLVAFGLLVTAAARRFGYAAFPWPTPSSPSPAGRSSTPTSGSASMEKRS